MIGETLAGAAGQAIVPVGVSLFICAWMVRASVRHIRERIAERRLMRDGMQVFNPHTYKRISEQRQDMRALGMRGYWVWHVNPARKRAREEAREVMRLTYPVQGFETVRIARDVIAFCRRF